MQKLNIAAPFSFLEEVEALVEAGADELYCGYLDQEWIRKFSPLEFERKGGKAANFLELKSLKTAVKRAHRLKVPLALTVNGLYVGQQYPLLRKIISKLDDTGADAFIVADLGLLLTLAQARTRRRLYVSTGGTVFNSAAVSFYEQFPVSRIVLDRQVPLSDIVRIASLHPRMEFEVFILNTLCVYIDGFCTYLHTYAFNCEQRKLNKGRRLEVVSTYDSSGGIDACCLDFRVSVLPTNAAKAGIRPRFFKKMTDGVECGVCALYDLVRSRVHSVKIVGRQIEPHMRLKSIRLVRSCLDILEADPGISRREYTGRAQEIYREMFDYKNTCSGNNCYHPSVLAIQ